MRAAREKGQHVNGRVLWIGDQCGVDGFRRGRIGEGFIDTLGRPGVNLPTFGRAALLLWRPIVANRWLA
jgi:hypothetical protein